MKDFLYDLASSEPTPGGGSVAALAGALAASLATMVGRLTLNRKKYADVEEEVLKLIDELEPAIGQFNNDVKRDAEAYASVMAAYRMPKETEAEQVIRNNAIEGASLYAIRVPLEVSSRAMSILPAIKRIAEIGNRNAITDAAVAALCCQTAIIGANLNVVVNLSEMKDKELAAKLEKEMKEATAIAMESAAQAVSYTYQKLSEQ